MGTFTASLALLLFLLALLSFIFNGGKNLIMIVISLELILLSVGVLLVTLSFNFDDLIGSNLTLFLLPLAGAESALALAFLVAYYPSTGSLRLR